MDQEKLANLVGRWEGTTTTWFEPGKPGVEEKIKGSFTPGVNENFVVFEYESSLQGNPFKGMAIYGYDSTNKKFQSAWVDGFHMGSAIMFSEGEATDKGFSVLGSYTYENIRWGWRTNIEMVNHDELILTSFNISPEGQENKAIETIYKRISE